MNRTLLALPLVISYTVSVLGAPAVAQEKPRVSRALIASLEKSIDQKFQKLFPDNPYLLLGDSRGVYLEGYGAVFSIELNPILAAGGPFRGKVTRQEVARHRKQKLERLPVLRTSAKQALLGAALSLDTVPPEEKVVLAVSIFQHSWEDLTGVPQQIVVSAQRKTLVQLQTSGADKSVLEASVAVKEY